jgi:hypothetical protein
MREQDDNRHARLLAALKVGELDLAEGRSSPYSSALLDEIEREARKHASADRKPDSDVVP